LAISREAGMNAHTVIIFDFAACDGEDGVIVWEPKTAEPEGVKGLAQLLTEFRGFVRGKRCELGRAVTTLAAITDANLPLLLSRAYRASFQTDEGRPTRARIAVPREPAWFPPLDQPRFTVEKRAKLAACRLMASHLGVDILNQVEDDRHHAYRFVEPILLDDHKPLVKLAPLLLERDGAITVKEVDGSLAVTGLALLDQTDSDRHILQMPRLWRPSAGLLIEIVGPGHLRVSEGPASFTLQADRLVTHHSLFNVDLVRRWLFEVSTAWVDGFTKHPDYDPEAKLFDSPKEETTSRFAVPHLDVWIAFERILREAISLGHGGVFAVVPDPNNAPLTIKRKIVPVDLGTELHATWAAHCRIAGRKNQPAATQLDAVEEKRTAAHLWVHHLTSIGRLSAADGCVVLDRRLVLHGFGGSIDTDLTSTELGACHDLTTENDVPAAELLKSFGERHKSAFALCRKVRNAIVFVVSQDGDLRVFASDAEGRVFFASNLSV
jgi:hypothetical protein